MKQILILFSILSILFSCSTESKKETSNKKDDNLFSHAKNIYSKSGSNKVTLYFNWDGHKDSLTYVLISHKDSISNSVDSKTIHIKTPITSVAALSTTHIAMINELKKISSITGVCDYFRICNPAVQQMVANKKIIDLGSSMNENQEQLIDLAPSVVFKTVFEQENFNKDEIYKSVGIPIIYTNSWTEETPLARAEWIKFFGLLYGVEKTANTLFNDIEREYNAYRGQAQRAKKIPVILAGDLIKDQWYCPGGKSYMAQYIKDAKGLYVFNKDNKTTSTPMHFENILEESQTAEIWLSANETTYSELYKKDSRYELLEVCQNKNCYSPNAKENTKGGNDFWETGYVRPDIVLADIINILHPEELPDHDLVFFTKLK